MPAIGINGQGHAVMGFTGCSAVEYAGAYFAGRLASSPAGFMGTPKLIHAGEVAMRVSHLTAGDRVRDVNFEVRRGEILGRDLATAMGFKFSVIEDLIEGLAPIDLSLADNFTEDLGVQITPPDVRSNTQKIYIPRSSMTSLQMIAVVTTPSRKKPLPRPAAEDLQEDLFSLELPPNARTH